METSSILVAGKKSKGIRKNNQKNTPKEKKYMSMYKKVDTSLNFVEREKEIVEYWNEKKVFVHFEYSIYWSFAKKHFEQLSLKSPSLSHYQIEIQNFHFQKLTLINYVIF